MEISAPSKVYVIPLHKTSMYNQMKLRYYSIAVKYAREAVPLTLLKKDIDFFLREAAKNADTMYYVTRIGDRTYSDEDIAPMFYGAPANVRLPEKWKDILQFDEGREFWKC